FLTILLSSASVLLIGCSDPPAEVEIDETRELTSKDERARLFTSSWRRFRPGERHYLHEVPEGWVRQPGTPMRKLNFAVGAGGEGEAYLSETMGSLEDNVNRWRGQFGLAPLSGTEVSALPRVLALGAELTLVEATGDYAAGMGRPPQSGYALAGVIGSTGDGVITVKMVGPEEVVEAERDRFLDFCKSLSLAQ
ncbi:MAG: hypothetical protein GWO24_00505, partial [Akkermansiaceae bacterium]|nr:hypothetical protein [Akkermansiaceae bacterium]